MEKIKKALEKAQQQRNNSGQSAFAPNIITRQEERPKAIVYSQTRSVKVSPELLRKNRIIAGFDDDPRADIYKILRTKVLHKMQANDWNMLAITSPNRGAGKTLTATNLAISIAQHANYSVLLADLDFRNPTVHQYFGIPPEPGLSDYFSGEKDIPELLVHPEIEDLIILPAGKPVKRSSDLLSTTKMQNLAKELKTRYPDRIVIVDLPPLLQTDDALVFMPNVDACILVVAEGENTEDEVRNSIQLIENKKYLGTVLNKSQDVRLDEVAY